MNKMNKVLSATVGLAAVGVLLAMSTTNAQAAFVLRVSDGTTTVIVQDDSAAGTLTSAGNTTNADGSAVAGLISFTGTVGNFNFVSEIGSSKPLLGAGSTKFDLFSVNITSIAAGGTLTVELTDTDFVSPSVATATAFIANIGGTAGHRVTLNHAVVDPNNVEFSAGPVDISDGGLSFGAGAFSASFGNKVMIGAGPHSLSIMTTIVHTAAGQVSSFDAEIKVPEPGSLALFGFGLLGLGFLARRRSARPAAN